MLDLDDPELGEDNMDNCRDAMKFAHKDDLDKARAFTACVERAQVAKRRGVQEKLNRLLAAADEDTVARDKVMTDNVKAAYAKLQTAGEDVKDKVGVLSRRIQVC